MGFSARYAEFCNSHHRFAERLFLRLRNKYASFAPATEREPLLPGRQGQAVRDVCRLGLVRVQPAYGGGFLPAAEPHPVPHAVHHQIGEEGGPGGAVRRKGRRLGPESRAGRPGPEAGVSPRVAENLAQGGHAVGVGGVRRGNGRLGRATEGAEEQQKRQDFFHGLQVAG